MRKVIQDPMSTIRKMSLLGFISGKKNKNGNLKEATLCHMM